MALAALAAVAFFIIRRRKQGRGNQPPPPPPTQEVPEYYKVQPTSPILRPTSGNTSYSHYYVRSPSFRPSASVAYLYNASSTQNPEDPTTFPPQIGDGQSSLTYLNPLSQGPHGQAPGRYSGVPEI